MLKQAGLVTGLAAAAMVLSAIPALADDWWDSVNCSQNPSPGCELGVGHVGHGAGSGSHGGDAPAGDSSGSGIDFSGCRFDPVDFTDPGKPAPQGPGGWFMITCPPDFQDGPVWIANGTAQPALSPLQVAQLARKKLRLPEPRIASNPIGDQLVNLPTWLWLSDGWRPASATAAVPGLSVTATAKPTSVSWSMGDGGIVDCADSGTPYRDTGNPSAPSPDCGYVYRHSSAAEPGNTFRVTATIRWTISWSGGGQAGNFPGLTTSSTAAYRVAESQALGNR